MVGSVQRGSEHTVEARVEAWLPASEQSRCFAVLSMTILKVIAASGSHIKVGFARPHGAEPRAHTTHNERAAVMTRRVGQYTFERNT